MPESQKSKHICMNAALFFFCSNFLYNRKLSVFCKNVFLIKKFTYDMKKKLKFCGLNIRLRRSFLQMIFLCGSMNRKNIGPLFANFSPQKNLALTGQPLGPLPYPPPRTWHHQVNHGCNHHHHEARLDHSATK